jgi:hypothetical protein
MSTTIASANKIIQDEKFRGKSDPSALLVYLFLKDVLQYCTTVEREKIEAKITYLERRCPNLCHNKVKVPKPPVPTKVRVIGFSRNVHIDFGSRLFIKP